MQDWSENPYQTERGYCLAGITQDTTWLKAGYRAIYVTQATRAHATDSTQMTVDFVCDKGQPTLHTHAAYCTITPWGVDLFSCSMHRPEAEQCSPSLTDVASLLVSEAPFNVIQCGKEQFRFYWATDYLWMLGVTPHDLQQRTHGDGAHHTPAVHSDRASVHPSSVSHGRRSGNPGESRAGHVETWLDRGRRGLYSIRRHDRGGGR